MIGPIINSTGIIAGSFLGSLLGSRIPVGMRQRLPLVFGCISMGLGITMIVEVRNLPPVVFAVLLGTIIGELLHLEKGSLFLAEKSRSLVERFVPPPDNELTSDDYMAKFVAILVLCSISGTGLFGALKEGMDGDPSLLIVKAFLDFFTVGIFAASLGFSIAVAAVPQFIIQIGLFFVARQILPMINEVMVADFSAVGGIIMLATGLKICNIAPFPITNMLPSLLIAMPFTVLWMKITG